METRTKHTYKTHLYEFVKDISVICPKCDNKALVKTGDFSIFKYEAKDVKVVCSKCGFNKTLDKIATKGKHLIFGAPVDPFFHLPVWYQDDFIGNVLWAYNPEHLEFLEQHVGAKLRERNGFKHQIKTIGAKLPRWMTTKNNREVVLKTLLKLKSK